MEAVKNSWTEVVEPRATNPKVFQFKSKLLTFFKANLGSKNINGATLVLAITCCISDWKKNITNGSTRKSRIRRSGIRTQARAFARPLELPLSPKRTESEKERNGGKFFFLCFVSSFQGRRRRKTEADEFSRKNSDRAPPRPRPKQKPRQKQKRCRNYFSDETWVDEDDL